METRLRYKKAGIIHEGFAPLYQAAQLMPGDWIVTPIIGGISNPSFITDQGEKGVALIREFMQNEGFEGQAYIINKQYGLDIG